MTVETTTNKIIYAGNGLTTVFPYDFKIFADADLVVTEVLIADPFTQTVKTLTTEYTVSGAGDATGGNVTMVTAPASGVRLVIQRVLDLEQGLDLVENDPSPADTREEAWDRDVMMIQQLDEENDRAMKLPVDISGVSTELPPPEAGKAPTWNSTATAMINVTNPGVAADEAEASAVAAAASEAAAATSEAAAAVSATAAAVSALAAAASAASIVVDDVTLEKTTDLHIKALGVDTAQLAADAVTGAKIEDDAVDSEHIANLAVDTAQLAALAVTEAKIEAATITSIRENHIKSGDSAGGDLEGTYPDPTIIAKLLSGLLPDWHGDGSDGTPDFSGGGSIASDIVQYAALTIPLGQTVTCTQEVTIIAVAGTCTIAGALTAAGQGEAGGAAGGSAAPGSDGGAGGGLGTHGRYASGYDADTLGQSSHFGWLGGSGGGGGADNNAVDGGYGGGAGGTGGTKGATAAQAGGNGGAPGTSKLNYLQLSNRWHLVYGYGAGGGGGAGGTGGGGAGGAGGGSILILCKDLVFTGTIDCSGVDGSGAAESGGGGGGGGGGNIIIVADKITTNTGSVDKSGGSGGAAGSAPVGGAGGDGYTGIEEIVEI